MFEQTYRKAVRKGVAALIRESLPFCKLAELRHHRPRNCLTGQTPFSSLHDPKPGKSGREETLQDVPQLASIVQASPSPSTKSFFTVDCITQLMGFRRGHRYIKGTSGDLRTSASPPQTSPSPSTKPPQYPTLQYQTLSHPT